MKPGAANRGILMSVVAAAVLAAAAWILWPGPGREAPIEAGTDLPVAASSTGASATPRMAGEVLFNRKCAVCHGRKAVGSTVGPPLVHRVYEPGHHSDMAFLVAVRRGVRAHHWRFGDMAPVPGLSDEDVEEIVRYVRALQRAKGIY